MYNMWYKITVGALLVVVAVTLWVGFSYMEAATYNRITTDCLTPWDALWVGLNIQPKAIVRETVTKTIYVKQRGPVAKPGIIEAAPPPKKKPNDRLARFVKEELGITE